MKNHGRKIETKYENPIDGILVSLCEPISCILYKYNFTPNMITSIGLVVGILSIYFLIKKNYLVAFALFWLCYFFDCLDGYYARKYDMATKFGDYYDHFRDLFICTSVFVIIFLQLKDTKLRVFFITVMCVFGYYLCMHMGCQEHLSSYSENNDCLALFKNICKNKYSLSHTRFLGCGTFIMVLSFFILFLKYNK